MSKATANDQSKKNPNRTLRGKAVESWQKTREHAETYPYVWASYILVYGGLSAYMTWRWIKLRKTENRVRVLQARLRSLVESEGSVPVEGSQPVKKDMAGKKSDS